ncbi:MAG: SDR family oxidoreductase [Hymenobacter sp.]|nr:MAG: SDR family oxidoreductase [Hymenobacter sp.]
MCVKHFARCGHAQPRQGPAPLGTHRRATFGCVGPSAARGHFLPSPYLIFPAEASRQNCPHHRFQLRCWAGHGHPACPGEGTHARLAGRQPHPPGLGAGAGGASRRERGPAGREAATEFGTLDILANNAGVSSAHKPAVDVTPEEFEQTIRTDLFGPF